MEDHRDDHIVCADCGTSFLFSGGEAQVFADRGLAPPKRCKECRRVRKERNGESAGGGARAARPGAPGLRGGPSAGGWNGGGRDAGPPRGPRPGQAPRGAPPRHGPPRYTGDVNEYRSPMQDRSFTAAPWQSGPAAHPGGDQAFNRPPAAARGPRPSRQGGPGVYRDAGNYRPPSSHGEAQNGFARGERARSDQPRGDQPRGDQPRGDQPRPGALGADGAARRRPQAEMFSIKCDSCGVQAEVPFKPAEGREIFCPTCYRARKPV